ncbi:hypothetical protein FB451DRAFT_1387881 [Mycena latifolia]|nr:hypothetical protein FB451DRAFT_1387881 [Mycena latifolia]
MSSPTTGIAFLETSTEGDIYALPPYPDYDQFPPLPGNYPIFQFVADEFLPWITEEPEKDEQSLYLFNHWAIALTLPLMRIPERVTRVDPQYLVWLLDQCQPDAYGQFYEIFPMSETLSLLLSGLLWLFDHAPFKLRFAVIPGSPTSETKYARWRRLIPTSKFMRDFISTDSLPGANFHLPKFPTRVPKEFGPVPLTERAFDFFQIIGTPCPVEQLLPLLTQRMHPESIVAHKDNILPLIEKAHEDLCHFYDVCRATEHNSIPDLAKRFINAMIQVVAPLVETGIQGTGACLFTDFLPNHRFHYSINALPCNFQLPDRFEQYDGESLSPFSTFCKLPEQEQARVQAGLSERPSPPPEEKPSETLVEGPEEKLEEGSGEHPTLGYQGVSPVYNPQSPVEDFDFDHGPGSPFRANTPVPSVDKEADESTMDVDKPEKAQDKEGRKTPTLGSIAGSKSGSGDEGRDGEKAELSDDSEDDEPLAKRRKTSVPAVDSIATRRPTRTTVSTKPPDYTAGIIKRPKKTTPRRSKSLQQEEVNDPSYSEDKGEPSAKSLGKRKARSSSHTTPRSRAGSLSGSRAKSAPPPEHPTVKKKGRQNALREPYAHREHIPRVNVPGLIDNLGSQESRAGSILDYGCVLCISLDWKCTPTSVMHPCEICKTKNRGQCTHSRNTKEHHHIANQLAPYTAFSNTALNAAVATVHKDRVALGGLHAMMNNARLRLMESSYQLGALIQRHVEVFGAPTLADLHDIPDEVRDIYVDFLQKSAIDALIPYYENEEVVDAARARFVVPGATEEQHKKTIDLLLSFQAVQEAEDEREPVRGQTPPGPLLGEPSGSNPATADPFCFPTLPSRTPPISPDSDGAMEFIQVPPLSACNHCRALNRLCTPTTLGTSCGECLVTFARGCEFTSRLNMLRLAKDRRARLFEESAGATDFSTRLFQFYADLTFAFAVFNNRLGVDESLQLAAMTNVLSTISDAPTLSSILLLSTVLHLPPSIADVIARRIEFLWNFKFPY